MIGSLHGNLKHILSHAEGCHVNILGQYSPLLILESQDKGRAEPQNDFFFKQ